VISPARAVKLTSLTAGIERKCLEAFRSSSIAHTLCSKLYCHCQVECYIGKLRHMVGLSHTAAMILQALDSGCLYGFNLMETTGRSALAASQKRYPPLARMLPERETEHVK
jgi:hypothetical protein